MDSEDEYYSQMDSEEEDEGAYLDDDDDEYVDTESDDDVDDTIDPKSKIQQNYTVLSEDEIRARQEEDIGNITSVLSLSRVSAISLLCHYNWDVGKVNEAWFADEGKVRGMVGLMEEPVVHYDGKRLVCRICFDDYLHSKMSAAACGHLFCKTCWKSYISISISDGPGCLTLRCPDPQCRAAVGQDMVEDLVKEEDKDKYSRFLLRSYVESSKKIKWCPAPGCDYSVSYVVGSGNFDVTCKCSHGFCWNCAQEAHRPVDCETVTKWILKNNAESENVTWILANSKSCPKCKRPIQKNQGCMHMTCTPPCKYEFCWLCLDSWADHGELTGGFYACNRYEKGKIEGKYAEVERVREMAKTVIEKYTHYYERWAANESSKKKAIADLKQLQEENIEKLSNLHCQTELQLNFIIEAWQRIIECRHVLKWTYAYGYYIPDHEKAKKHFFEFVQNEAESWLERLHQCAEKDLQVHLKKEEDSEDFSVFRSKLLDLTIAARNFFDKLVRALENGLADVDSMNVEKEDEEEVEDKFQNSCLATMMNED